MTAWRRLLQAVRRRDRLAERQTGLTGAQLYALRQLALRPGVTVGELATLTATDASSVSVIMTRLLQKEMVSRVRDTTDHRRWRLVLTDAGRACLAGAPDSADVRLEQALSALPTPERLELTRRLRSLARALDLDPEPDPDPGWPAEGNPHEVSAVSSG